MLELQVSMTQLFQLRLQRISIQDDAERQNKARGITIHWKRKIRKLIIYFSIISYDVYELNIKTK